MHETRNNCFGSKECSTTLRQAKKGKHESRNVTATYEQDSDSFKYNVLIENFI